MKYSYHDAGHNDECGDAWRLAISIRRFINREMAGMRLLAMRKAEIWHSRQAEMALIGREQTMPPRGFNNHTRQAEMPRTRSRASLISPTRMR